MSPRLLVLTGSTRADSLNGRLAAVVDRVLRDEGAETVAVGLADHPMPLYDADREHRDGVPEAAVRLAALIADADGFVIAAPEHNASMTAAVKNALDWVSRIKPWRFIGRYGLLVAASPSALGGHRGLAALRTPLEAIGATLHPEMFAMSTGADGFAEDAIVDAAQADRLRRVATAFLGAVSERAAGRRVDAAA